MLAFLATPLGKYVAMFLSILVIIGIGYGMFKIWENQIEAAAAAAAVADFNKKQLDQIAQDNAKYQQQLQALSDAQSQILADQAKAASDLQSKMDDINNYLNSPQAKSSDKNSSDVLKETFKRLSQ